MTDKAIEVAHNPAAPADEQRDAMRVAQQDAMPSSVPDTMDLVRYVAEQYQEQQMQKAFAKPNVIPFPSRAVREKSAGMQSVWIDEQRVQVLGEWYERPSNFSFDMMRQMVDQTPILGAVILTRQRQVRRFCRQQTGGKGPGFQIKLKDESLKLGKEEAQSIQLLEGFFTNCGWESNPRQRARLKRDNFSGLMGKLVRDTLTMDSAAIETEYKRDRARGLDGLYAVDGSTIRLCNEVGYQGDDEIFALQVVEGMIRSAYTYDDLIYVPRNARSDVLAGGYGQAETELLIRVVTGYLNAFTYNTKYFDSNAIPKGLLHLAGEYGQDDLSAFRRYWNSMIKGINNAWSLPIMVSKNGESKASFEKFGVDVDEIMFAKWMTFLTSIICAIYGIAPDEINFESFTAGTSSLSGSDTEEKLINSKDKGLRPLLSYFEDLFSDYVVSDFGDKYCFRWTGLDELTPEQAWLEEQALLTLGEARKARGWDELKDEKLNNAPLNQTLMGVYMQSIQPEEPTPGPGDMDGNETQDDPSETGEKQGEDDGQKQPRLDEPMDFEMQKAFGLPVFRVEP